MFFKAPDFKCSCPPLEIQRPPSHICSRDPTWTLRKMYHFQAWEHLTDIIGPWPETNETNQELNTPYRHYVLHCCCADRSDAVWESFLMSKDVWQMLKVSVIQSHTWQIENWSLCFSYCGAATVCKLLALFISSHVGRRTFRLSFYTSSSNHFSYV